MTELATEISVAKLVSIEKGDQSF